MSCRGACAKRPIIRIRRLIQTPLHRSEALPRVTEMQNHVSPGILPIGRDCQTALADNIQFMKATSYLFRGAVIFAAFALVGMNLRAAEPFFEGLGTYSRKVTTNSPKAQRYFNQGLAFYHGFNHGAAIRSFQEAARLDPKCAMAHWGIALAHGPHINNMVMSPQDVEIAWQELQLAQQNAEHASPVERDLIEALSHRYANPQPQDRAPLDQAYADAMRTVWQKYPNDQDVGAFFAEAMMDLRPWNQWTPEGQANPGTDEILATLDAVLKMNPRHPFANHLYIHATEASPHPERAIPAADRLRQLQPGLAHNVHMPSHIDIRDRSLAESDRYEREGGRGRSALSKNRGAADRLHQRLCRAQPPHARLRGDDGWPT